ncbi:MAG: patatin-like phospholipase family protein [Methylococcales bacterium]
MGEQYTSREPILRVLSLDGGGIRGYLTARILVEIEKYLNVKTNAQKPLGERFDFVVGTSTGGLIALGLAVRKTAQELLEFYETYGMEIFGKTEKCSWLSALFKRKFRGEALKNHLEKDFFTTKKLLSEITHPHAAVISVALDTGMLRKYASEYLPLHGARVDESLVDCALATTAVPTFFPVREKMKHFSDLVDGGLVANNPAMVALIDACKILAISDSQRKPEREYASKVKMLSAGTGQVRPLPYYCAKAADYFLSNIKRMRQGGLLHWAKPIPEVLMSCNPRSLLQNRDLARPLLLSSRDLESGRPTREFRMPAVLWGRHAIAARELIVEILDQMGERGLNPEPDTCEPVRFEIAAIHAEAPITLAEGVESLLLLRPIGFRLDFETPFLVETKRNSPRGRGFSLADILGGCAFDLAAWDMEDRELPARSRQAAP